MPRLVLHALIRPKVRVREWRNLGFLATSIRALG